MQSTSQRHKAGKNYFEKGNWVNYVEGRWNSETKTTEFRVSTGKQPKGSSWWWHLNQDKATFSKHVAPVSILDPKCWYTMVKRYNNTILMTTFL